MVSAVLVAAVSTSYMLTSEDLEPRSTDKAEYMVFAFQNFGYLIKCNTFSFIHLPTKFMICFFFCDCPLHKEKHL